MIVPDCGREDAIALAEKLRLAVETLVLPEGAVSISVGVAFLQSSAKVPTTQLLDDADRALYAAKRGGRNRVSVRDDAVAGF